MSVGIDIGRRSSAEEKSSSATVDKPSCISPSPRTHNPVYYKTSELPADQRQAASASPPTRTYIVRAQPKVRDRERTSLEDAAAPTQNDDVNRGPKSLHCNTHPADKCCLQCCRPSLRCAVCETNTPIGHVKYCVVCDQPLRCPRCPQPRIRRCLRPGDTVVRVLETGT